MIENLLNRVWNHKIDCHFSKIDLDSGKSVQYTETLKWMTTFSETYKSYFGPEVLSAKSVKAQSL